MVRISEDEMRRMNETSVTLRNGSGYVGCFEASLVHTEKRCLLTTIRNGLTNPQHQDYYHKPKADDGFYIEHVAVKTTRRYCSYGNSGL